LPVAFSWKIAQRTPRQRPVSAASTLPDSGWGRPPQVHSGEDGGSIQVVIRQIIDSTEESAPLLIEHETQTRD
jgi:hypothetical protein